MSRRQSLCSAAPAEQGQSAEAPSEAELHDIDLQPALRMMHRWGLDDGDLGFAYWGDIGKLLVRARDAEAEIEALQAQLAGALCLPPQPRRLSLSRKLALKAR